MYRSSQVASEKQVKNQRRKMACANLDVDDFVTCGVCMNEYDTENKKPKFLQCSHTICLQCLKVFSNIYRCYMLLLNIKFLTIPQQICRDGSITCPFCRNTFVKEDVNSLPNNSYALHMLKLNEKKVDEPIKSIVNPL